MFARKRILHDCKAKVDRYVPWVMIWQYESRQSVTSGTDLSTYILQSRKIQIHVISIRNQLQAVIKNIAYFDQPVLLRQDKM